MAAAYGWTTPGIGILCGEVVATRSQAGCVCACPASGCRAGGFGPSVFSAFVAEFRGWRLIFISLIELPVSRDFRNRTAMVKIDVATLNGFIGDHVGHEHSGVKVDGIRARWNAFYSECSLLAVIADSTGFPVVGNQMQRPAVVAHNPIPHWHIPIMLR